LRNHTTTLASASLFFGLLAVTAQAQRSGPHFDPVNRAVIQPPSDVKSQASARTQASQAGSISVTGLPTAPITDGVSIDFDGGNPGSPVDDFYADLGVHFSNAAWREPLSATQAGTPSSGVSLVTVTDDGFNPPFSPTEATPIVASFSRAVNTVSILAVDVGSAGARLRAFDGIIGGNLVGEDTYVTTGPGVGEFDTLTVTGVGIRRIELFQPFPNTEDGLIFDNMTFGDVVVIDFETTDDFETALANGEAIVAAGAFDSLVSITGQSASGDTAAIFDSTPGGPNQGSQDPDLLVGLGNVLILQDGPLQSVPGVYDFPNDHADGGDIDISFPGLGAGPVSVDLIDLCPGDNQTTTVTLTDGESRTLVYEIPSGWTEDVSVEGPLGYRTLDLTTLDAQPGFMSTATASMATGFDAESVVSMRVSFQGSGAMDNLAFRPNASALTVETFESFREDTVLSTQIPGLSISADDGTPTVVDADNPVIPGESLGLAHLPYFNEPDILQINFEPSTSTAGAFIDFGNVGSGIRITAYSGPNATGDVLGTSQTQTESFIGVTAPGIRSVRFENVGGATYLIDNLTYRIETITP
jgi:hypothetical protein